MRLLVIENYDVLRGAAISMRKLLELLKTKYGVDITILAVQNNQNDQFCSDLDIDRYITGHKSFVIEKPQDMNWLRFKTRLLRNRGLINKANSEAFERAKQLVLDEHKFDAVYTNVLRYDLGHRISKEYHILHVVHLREFMDVDFEGYPINPGYFEKLDEYTWAYIAISQAVKDHFVSMGFPADKIRVIYNGVDTSIPQRDENKAFDGLKMVIVGQIIEAKGQLQAVRALTLLPDEMKKRVQLDIYGNGDDEYISKIKRVASENNLNVNLMGFAHDVNDRLKNYDVGLVCSKAEAFGRVTAEYMMAGLCVIASDTGANPEIVINGKSGLLYPYGDTKKLAECICQIYDNPQMISSCGITGRNRSMENYTAEKNADSIYNLLLNGMAEDAR